MALKPKDLQVGVVIESPYGVGVIEDILRGTGGAIRLEVRFAKNILKLQQPEIHSLARLNELQFSVSTPEAFEHQVTFLRDALVIRIDQALAEARGSMFIGKEKHAPSRD